MSEKSPAKSNTLQQQQQQKQKQPQAQSQQQTQKSLKSTSQQQQNNVSPANTNVFKNIVLHEQDSLDGPPLDFSFKNIKDLAELKTMEPRSGKRKPIQQEEEEPKEESKKLENEEENQKPENDQPAQKEEDEQQKQEGNQEEGENKNKEKKEEKKKEDKKIHAEIIRAVPQNVAPSIISSHHVQINNGGQKSGSGNVAGGKQYEEQKNNMQKKVMKINLVCTSLILSYNKIRSLDKFDENIACVMEKCENLAWIDLSHNYLEVLDYNFSKFPQLKSLYLHCNYLKDLKELQKLATLPELRTLTIHGNPVETIPNFRLYIIGMLPYLKRLDSVLISKKERDNAAVWILQFKYVNPPIVKNAQTPPVETQPTNQNEAGKAN